MYSTYIDLHLEMFFGSLGLVRPHMARATQISGVVTLSLKQKINIIRRQKKKKIAEHRDGVRSDAHWIR